MAQRGTANLASAIPRQPAHEPARLISVNPDQDQEMETTGVTMRSIAELAHVSVMTVSYSLRNDPRISAETRKRVQGIARQLDYRPDPYLSRLMHHLSARRRTKERGAVAFINRHNRRYFAESAEIARRFLDGAVRRARSLGYLVTEFSTAEGNVSSNRLSSILVSRGIQGVIVGPSYKPSELGLAWERFASVTLGTTLTRPDLNRVAANRYADMGKALDEAARRGFTRVGIVDTECYDARTSNLSLARFLLFQQSVDAANRIKPMFVEQPDREMLDAWVKRSRPEIVISVGPCVHRFLTALGYRTPHDFSYISLTNWDSTGEIAGIRPNATALGTTAMDILAGQLNSHELGVPPCPKVTYVDGIWHDGASLR